MLIWQQQVRRPKLFQSSPKLASLPDEEDLVLEREAASLDDLMTAIKLLFNTENITVR